MTPDERAEKIYNEYGRKGSWNLFDKRMIKAIAAQIQEAVEEAERAMDLGIDEAYSAGFTDAKERAKGIAENYDGKGVSDHGYDAQLGDAHRTMWDIAELIAKLEPEA